MHVASFVSTLYNLLIEPNSTRFNSTCTLKTSFLCPFQRESNKVTLVITSALALFVLSSPARLTPTSRSHVVPTISVINKTDSKRSHKHHHKARATLHAPSSSYPTTAQKKKSPARDALLLSIPAAVRRRYCNLSRIANPPGRIIARLPHGVSFSSPSWAQPAAAAAAASAACPRCV